ncbi:uncharacterized protein PHACADRAFT_246006 [Phanerochaete carnosa HHB-10118-sp]|uniref:Uncharacterized protein n=1 Tax=Phanerochaete carnosa (strain HHB-10118-sp) TaxID=650164 RepID=K5VB89_PHACS|nr:uncharacterized protein PHACADRAFT_246006 [Phanerochaete carnosa HHB-10118-sp]EKM60166.1 hypothetical protein PHACADRAFT_246006 [Phanerochaete carnosa HHB-10118-sp]
MDRLSGTGVYSPSRGLDVIEATPRPRSSPAHPMELIDNGLSLIPTSHSTGSSSSASGSTPITPLNVPVSDELMYSLDFPPSALVPSSGFTPELGSFSQFEGPSAWLCQDMDPTPTLAGDDKSFTMLERELIRHM